MSLMISTISKLDRISDYYELSSGSYFVADVPQGKKESYTEISCISRKILLEELLKSLNQDLYIPVLESKLKNIQETFNVPSSFVEIRKNYLISALLENSRSQLKSLSAYKLEDALQNILSCIELSGINLLSSPWVFLSDIVDEIQADETESTYPKVASLSLLHDVYSKFENYAYLSDILSTFEESPSDKNMVTPGVLKSIDEEIERNFLGNSHIEKYNLNDNGYGVRDLNKYVISQGLLSAMCEPLFNKYIKKTNISKELSQDNDTDFYGNVVSVSLIKDISSEVSSNYAKKTDADLFVKKEDGINLSQLKQMSSNISLSILGSFLENVLVDTETDISTFTQYNRYFAQKNTEAILAFMKYDEINKKIIIDEYNILSDIMPLNVQQEETVIDKTDKYYTIISPLGYKDYDFAVRIKSSNTNCNQAGLVAGYTTDLNGKSVMMWFEREQNNFDTSGVQLSSVNNGNSKWRFKAVKDGEGFIESISSYQISGTFKDSNDNVISYGTEADSSWNLCEGGTIIKISKRGNKISAWTSKFGDLNSAEEMQSGDDWKTFVPQLSDLSQESLLTVDLEENQNLSDFVDKNVAIGFMVDEQPNVKFEILEHVTPLTLIGFSENQLNSADGYFTEVSVYNVNQRQFEVQEKLGKQGIARNYFSGRLYYIRDNYVCRI